MLFIGGQEVFFLIFHQLFNFLIGKIFSLLSFGIVVPSLVIYLILLFIEDVTLASGKWSIISMICLAELFMGGPVSFIDGLFVVDLVHHDGNPLF